MADINTVYSGLDKCRKCDCDDCVLFNASKAPWDCPAKDKLIDDAMELLKVYKEKIESASEKTTLIDEALEVGRCVLRRGIYIPGSGKQWIRVSMTIKEAEKIFGTLRQMKDKQT